MKWLLAGLAFALAIGLAVGTAAIRAENTRQRQRLERQCHAIQDRVAELTRLSIRALQQATPERMAASLRANLAQRASRSAAAQS